FVEVFNAKVADAAHNAAAAALAARHDLPATAGSDAHDGPGVGAAYVEMPEFDGPADFLERLAAGRVVGELRPHARRFPSLDTRRDVPHDRDRFSRRILVVWAARSAASALRPNEEAACPPPGRPRDPWLRCSRSRTSTSSSTPRTARSRRSPGWA